MHKVWEGVDMTYMKDIKELYVEYQKLQEELDDILESFMENPTVVNKKKVKGKVAEFNKVKNSLIAKISDFWCKCE